MSWNTEPPTVVQRSMMAFFRCAVLALVPVLLGITAAVAQDFDKGLAAAEHGDYAAALREWHPLAENGLPQAQYHLGNMYRYGRGVPQDAADAVKWYARAAQAGMAEAQHALAWMHETGALGQPDFAEAVRWYRMAAEQGYAESQFSLGNSYRTGRGVPSDDAEAVKWYRKAAEQDHGNAQINLGNHYLLGRGVARDFAEAATWFRRAAGQGYASASNSLGILHEKGQGVPQDTAEAEKWFRKAAEQGDARAQYQPGLLLPGRPRCRAGRCSRAHVADPVGGERLRARAQGPRHRCPTPDAGAACAVTGIVGGVAGQTGRETARRGPVQLIGPAPGDLGQPPMLPGGMIRIWRPSNRAR